MYDDMIIYAYNTHYKIFNYDMGDCKGLENALSTWDPVYFKRTYYCHYDEKNRILYVPGAFDETKLRELTGKLVMGDRKETTYDKIYFTMKCQPRDAVQKESIRFLLGKNEYDFTRTASQLVLALIGGGGKTYCSSAAMSVLEMKTLIVCHTSDLIKQWIERLSEYTNIPDSSIVKLSSTEQLMEYVNPSPKTIRRQKKEYVYILSHSLIHNFITKEGFVTTNTLFNNMGIGLKIIDEFHRNFSNTLLIDYATNVKKTFYLSATPGRTDRVEDMVFQMAFDRAYKFRREAEDFGREANTIAIYDIFDTHAIHIDVAKMFVAKKFNIYKYIQYELDNGKVLSRIIFWLKWLYDGKVSDGTIYIVSPTKESCGIINKIVNASFPDKKCCAHFSGNKVDNLDDYDIVCGTVKMLGTGTDISNLKAMIVSEPVGSAVNADQLIHRLMRGKNNGTTYSIDLIDKSVPNVYNMYLRRKKIYTKFVKQNIVYKSYEEDRSY